MVSFAAPPREPNRWFLEQEPVPVVLAPAPARRRRAHRTRRQRLTFPVGAVLLFATALGVVAQLPTRVLVPVDSFARNRFQIEAARLLVAQLPAVPRLRDVRRLMGEAQLFCRPATGVGGDSLLTCLGHAVRHQAVYSRMAFRIVSRKDSVTQVSACPALVVHGAPAPPELVARARPTAPSAACWRDPGNPVDAEWAWTALPDTARFTLVPEPDAPRMRVESASSRDTITVIW